MEHTEAEKGVAVALLKRLVDERLPRLLEMQARVEKGELLSDFDIEYLEKALQDANHNQLRGAKFPEYGDIIGKVAALYQQITSKALDNQNAQKT